MILECPKCNQRFYYYGKTICPLCSNDITKYPEILKLIYEYEGYKDKTHKGEVSR